MERLADPAPCQDQIGKTENQDKTRRLKTRWKQSGSCSAGYAKHDWNRSCMAEDTKERPDGVGAAIIGKIEAYVFVRGCLAKQEGVTTVLPDFD